MRVFFLVKVFGVLTSCGGWCDDRSAPRRLRYVVEIISSRPAMLAVYNNCIPEIVLLETLSRSGFNKTVTIVPGEGKCVSIEVFLFSWFSKAACSHAVSRLLC